MTNLMRFFCTLILVVIHTISSAQIDKKATTETKACLLYTSYLDSAHFDRINKAQIYSTIFHKYIPEQQWLTNRNNIKFI